MNNQIIMWSMLIIPWFTLPFMKKDSIKRFSPAIILTALIVTITHEIAHAFRWWIALDSIVPWGYITNISYSYGLFLVGTYWVFHFTYRRFWLYMLLNTAIGGLWVFPILHFLERMKIFQYVNINEWFLWLINIIIALIIYSYQVWHDHIFSLKD
ncbi:hypothetical protein [Sporomusa acidovorans]|uniref:Peptidase family M50 n=1 Tax=Sporomusa acidovorans (strain ATCC 49682 / DSM 3132 / Mol) TaxID=1123286 RepID=A0ABZ3J9P2_SPOA4|nr:hypothetical protein [Sporomusa acidovorans]OZC16163.1 hypothetical protein SPACI_45300 [Sporomusa acidovorans DSM 3132]SDE29564.1 hypothetical protein SAMN04488499_101128 [Sporomusa acidovorans]